jgi:hypothetical protein
MVRFEEFAAHPNRGIAAHFFYASFSTMLRRSLIQINTSSLTLIFVLSSQVIEIDYKDPLRIQ